MPAERQELKQVIEQRIRGHRENVETLMAAINKGPPETRTPDEVKRGVVPRRTGEAVKEYNRKRKLWQESIQTSYAKIDELKALAKDMGVKLF